MRKFIQFISLFILVISFSINATGQTISGSIHDPGGDPVGGNILLVDSVGNHLADFWTDHLGNFITHPLDDGTYFVVTRYTGDMLDEAWDNVPCENWICDVPGSTPIVIDGSNVTGIDFVLEPITEGGHISGNLSGLGGPLAGTGVTIMNRNVEHLVDVITGPDGNYQTPLLANDDYYLHTVWEPLGLGSELYDDQPCEPWQFCRDPAFVKANGTVVTILSADMPDVDFSLVVPPGLGMISGRLTDADLDIPLPDVHMVLMSEHGDHVTNTNTDSLGDYYFSGLGDGGYKVIAIGVWPGYSGELYDNIPCHDWSCDTATEGSVINITGANTVGGIDFDLDFVGTRILGTITRSDTNEPVSSELAHMAVDWFNVTGEWLGHSGTNRAGQYQIQFPGTGDYYLVTGNDWQFHGLVNEGWNNHHCFYDCNPVSIGADLVRVEAGTTVVADFLLEPGFELSGSIKIEGGLTGHGWVNIWDKDGHWVTSSGNDGGGDWMSAPLPAGTYFASVRGEDFGMVSQLYNGNACPQEFCDVTGGTPIVVTDSAITGIDFDLVPFSADWTISGSIRDPGGNPVGGNVILVDPAGNHIADYWTDDLGNFTTDPLANGTYFAVTRLTGDMLDEAWDNVPCENMTCNIPGSTPIVVNGGNVTGIDFVLEPITRGGHISGTLSGPGGPLPSGGVTIMNRNFEHMLDVRVGHDGHYQTELLANDDYYVHTIWEPLGLGSELYDDQPCLPHQCSDPAFVAANATVVTIADTDRPDIDFSLEVPSGLGMISGQITDTDTGVPLTEIHMNLLNEHGHYRSNTNTDRYGNYYFSGLDDGNYKIAAIHVPDGYSWKLYDDVPCHEWSCNTETEGAIVNISGANTVSGIDISLDFIGTRVMGTVTRSDTGAPVSSEFAHMSLDLFNDNHDFIGGWPTNRFGQYQIILPGAGSFYLAVTNDWNYYGLVNEAWDNIKCYHDCSPLATGAPLIPVAEGTTVVADFLLDPGFELSGSIRVEGVLTGHSVVNIWDEDGHRVQEGWNDGSGNWMSVPLPAGTYYATVRGEDFGMVSQLYDGIACPQEFCDVTGGTPIVVTNSAVSGIDFDLMPVSPDWTISGTIRDPGGNPVGGNVLLVDPFGNHITDPWTDHLGNFTTNLLANGTYFAVTRFTGNMLDEAWDGVPCENMTCAIHASTPIVVDGGNVTGIDFVLEPITGGGHISGTLSGPGGPLPSGGVTILNRNFEHMFDVNVGPDGHYQTQLLANDDYYVHTLWEPLGLGSELYDNQPCMLHQCRDPAFVAANATVVTITDVDRPDISFNLEVPPGGMISGQVTDSDLGIPLPGVNLILMNEHGHHVGNADTDGLGNYYLSGLDDGDYKLIAIHVPEGYSGKLYDDVFCHEWSCDTNTGGAVINITGANTVGGIDFALDFIGTRILGTITRSDTQEPVSSHLAHMAVDLFNESGGYDGSWFTNQAGQYQVILPGAGNYYLAAINDWNFHSLVNEVWDNIQVYHHNHPFDTGATLIPVEAGTTVIADFVLDPGFTLSGSIRIEGGLTDHGMVNIWDQDGHWVTDSVNNGGGDWKSPPLPAGTYYATMRGEDFGMVGQLYDDIACPQEFCDVTGGTPIVVTDAAVTGIDFDLMPISADWTISGTIRDPGGNKLGGGVLLVDPIGNHLDFFWTDHLGNFITYPLADGVYFAITMHTGDMLDEAWDNFPCENRVCDIPASTPIIVNGGNVTGIDFVLEPITQGGRILGNLSGPGGPLPSGGVSILNRNFEHILDVGLGPGGNYQTELLASDDYYVHTLWEPLGLGSELYDDQPCMPHQCRDPAFVAANAAVVTVTNADKPNIDFSLEVPPGLGMISGQVTDTDLGIPLPDVHMNLLNEHGHYRGNTNTDRFGNYYFSGLEDGNYKVIAIDVPEGYSGELYDNVPCHDWSCNTGTEGATISITAANTVGGIDLSLDFVGTRIMGTITRGDTHEPVSSVFGHMAVDLYNDTGVFLGNWRTNRAGQYQIILHGAGSYYLAAINDKDYHDLANQAWYNIRCYHDCSPFTTGATLVPIAEGTTVIADFVLDPNLIFSSGFE